MTHDEHNERAARLLAVMQAGKRGELGPDVALLAEAYAELSEAICWETDCVHLARAMDVLASAMRERDELKAIEAAAREYAAAIDAEDAADDTRRGALAVAWLATNAAADRLRAALAAAQGDTEVG